MNNPPQIYKDLVFGPLDAAQEPGNPLVPTPPRDPARIPMRAARGDDDLMSDASQQSTPTFEEVEPK